jgi:hypothetical protein
VTQLTQLLAQFVVQLAAHVVQLQLQLQLQLLLQLQLQLLPPPPPWHV